MPGKRCYYEILGVERRVDGEEIKRAYRQLAMKYHPDRNAGDPEAELQFKEAAEAYQVLSDPDKRERYDRYGHAGLEGLNGRGFADAEAAFDLFGDILGGFFSGRRRGPKPGRNLRVDVELDLVEAARGVTRTVQFQRQELCGECAGWRSRRGSKPAQCRRCQGLGVVQVSQGFFSIGQPCRACGGGGTIITDPCPACRGDGRVTARREVQVSIPAGVDTGHCLDLPGEGEAGEPGGPRGVLRCFFHVREHVLFHRDGPNLICQVPITFSQAALGADIEVPTLEGPLTKTLKRGIQGGEVLRLSGKGMPVLQRSRRGDLLVQIVVETPRNLNKRQEELFRELAELEQKHVSPERKSFLDKLRNFFTGEQTGTNAARQ